MVRPSRKRTCVSSGPTPPCASRDSADMALRCCVPQVLKRLKHRFMPDQIFRHQALHAFVVAMLNPRAELRPTLQQVWEHPFLARLTREMVLRQQQAAASARPSRLITPGVSLPLLPPPLLQGGGSFLKCNGDWVCGDGFHEGPGCVLFLLASERSLWCHAEVLPC